MVNKVKYQIEVELELESLDSDLVKTAGLELAGGVNAGVNQNTNVTDVEIKDVKAEVSYIIDCTPPYDVTDV